VPRFSGQGNVPRVVFSSARVGYAWSPGGRLYVTHNGGASWRPTGPDAVRSVVLAGGEAYGFFAPSRIERSPVGSRSWKPLSLPARLRWPLALSAQGSDVWLLATPKGPLGAVGDVTLRSVDGGRTFSESAAPCIPGLGGTLIPAGGRVVWAVCPSGMAAGLTLSTDGGVSFPLRRSFHDPGGTRLPFLTNGADIVTPSATAAVLYQGAAGPLYRTTDTGRHWIRVSGTADLQEVFLLAFSSSRDGALIATTRSHPVRASLWRTTDGGASWHVLPVR
jgi:photosystem II stability/assembly factor-like uncharacterized protein